MKIGKGLIAIIITVLILVFGFSYVWSTRSMAVKLENKIEAQYTSNKSNYDKMWKKLVEMTQVTELQANQFKDVYTGLITGRYQDTGLLMKAIKEENPKLDTAVYTQIQREIAAGRNEFDNNQKKVIDITKEYNDIVDNNLVLMLMGKKHIDPNQFIVTSERTSNAFDTKKDEVIDITGKKK